MPCMAYTCGAFTYPASVSIKLPGRIAAFSGPAVAPGIPPAIAPGLLRQHGVEGSRQEVIEHRLSQPLHTLLLPVQVLLGLCRRAGTPCCC